MRGSGVGWATLGSFMFEISYSRTISKDSIRSMLHWIKQDLIKAWKWEGKPHNRKLYQVKI